MRPLALALLTACAPIEDVEPARQTYASHAQGALVQTGLTTSVATGTTTATISPVDRTRAFLLFTSAHAGDRPTAAEIRGVLTDDHIDFIRVSDEVTPVPITLRWYVVEYATGVRVQRGDIAITAGTMNIPIAPVASLTQAFVLHSRTPTPTGADWGEDDLEIVDLTTPSNLQLRTDDPLAGHVASWQVVELEDATWISVQRGSAALTGGALTTTVTLPAAVDPARTFVLAQYKSTGSGADVGARLLSAELTDATTIELRRDAAGDTAVAPFDDLTEIAWQAVELRDGSSVQRGVANFGVDDNSETATIAAVDPARATAFSGVESGAGQSVGRSSYVGNDVPGVASVTATVSATQVALERAVGPAPAAVAWQVVEWGPTCGDGAVEGDEQCDSVECCQACLLVSGCTMDAAGSDAATAGDAGATDARPPSDGAAGDAGGGGDAGDETMSFLTCDCRVGSSGRAPGAAGIVLLALGALSVARSARRARVRGSGGRSPRSGRGRRRCGRCSAGPTSR